jgi:hypothetical protein
VPDWDVCVEPTRLLCDALWHDLAMAVRSQRRVGRFRNSIDDSMCLVVDAQVLGEPDPDLARVLEVGWFTRTQMGALAGAGLLAGGFELAALDRAQEQRQHTLSAAVCHLGGVLLDWVHGTPELGLPDGVVVAGAPRPAGQDVLGVRPVLPAQAVVPGALMDHTPLRRFQPVCHSQADADAAGVELTNQANGIGRRRKRQADTSRTRYLVDGRSDPCRVMRARGVADLLLDA